MLGTTLYWDLLSCQLCSLKKNLVMSMCMFDSAYCVYMFTSTVY